MEQMRIWVYNMEDFDLLSFLAGLALGLAIAALIFK